MGATRAPGSAAGTCVLAFSLLVTAPREDVAGACTMCRLAFREMVCGLCAVCWMVLREMIFGLCAVCWVAFRERGCGLCAVRSAFFCRWCDELPAGRESVSREGFDGLCRMLEGDWCAAARGSASATACTERASPSPSRLVPAWGSGDDFDIVSPRRDVRTPARCSCDGAVLPARAVDDCSRAGPSASGCKRSGEAALRALESSRMGSFVCKAVCGRATPGSAVPAWDGTPAVLWRELVCVTCSGLVEELKRRPIAGGDAGDSVASGESLAALDCCAACSGW